MAYAVFIRDPHTGYHYQRSIWYSETRRVDAEEALLTYMDVTGSKPVMVCNLSEEGE